MGLIKLRLIIYTTLMCVSLHNNINAQNPLPCALTWVETSRGLPLPPKAVQSDGGAQLVSRARIPRQSVNSLGRVETESRNGYFPYRDQQHNLTAYEILTNPLDCILAWLPYNHELSIRFPVSSTNGQIVGRAILLDKNIMASGYISGQRLYVADGGQVITFNSQNYTVLSSISKGMEMAVNGFKFDTSPQSPSFEMVGKDEIVNESGATAYQTITHTKNITEGTKLTTNFQWNIARSVTVNMCIFVACQKLSILKFTSSSTNLQVTQNKEMSLIRTIEVPPGSSVEVCSVIEKADYYTSTWNAVAEFKCAGKSAEEVITELRRNPSWSAKQFTIFGNTAVTNVNGTYSGNFVMSSKFIAAEIGSGNCS